jgi:hypothetical protein
MATGKLYAKGLAAVLQNGLDLDGTTLKCSLHISGASIQQNTHTYLSSVGSEHAAVGGQYTTGGVTLTNCSVTSSGAVIKFDCDDAVWANASISCYYAVIYNASGANSTAWNVMAYIDLGGTQTSSSGTFSIVWSSGGIFTIDVT